MNIELKNCKTSLVRLIIVLLLFSFNSKAQITTGTLIKEMVDLKRLSEYPSPYYNTVQYSSFDRRSTFPDAPGWFENADGFGGEPIPGFEKVLQEPGSDGIGEYLICDAEGPGAIVRLWTAAINGTIRLYLDGEKEPVYDGSAFDFFTQTYKAMAAEDTTDFDGSFTQNMAGYYPVPFAKRCKIIWRGNIKDLHFYHVNMRLYEKGASIKTFSLNDIETFSEEIKTAQQILMNPDSVYSFEKGGTIPFAIGIESGEEKEITNIKGNKGITCLEMKIWGSDIKKALRKTVLRISFDGASVPQVESPAGDFFGTAAGINPYQSLPFTITEDGKMTCRYFMTFKESASIKIENFGDEKITVTGKVTTEKYNWDEARSMYFRVRWKVGHNLLASPEHPVDINYLTANGKGVFVGAAAHLMNPSEVPSIYGNWWGEGDEKIFVDDNPSPVFFGTGSEDYFNYAWSSPDIFYHAYCGQPRNDGPGTRGFVTNYRWHIIDNIPFKNHFAFYMELLSHEPVPGFSYARIVYHYGFRGMHSDNNSIAKDDVKPINLPEKWMPLAKKGSANAVFYQAENILSEKKNTSLVSGPMWAGGQLLEWAPEQAGEKFVLNLPVSEDGNYTVYITARLDEISGAFRATIDDADFKQETRTIGLHTEHGVLSRTFSSDGIKLAKGIHRLILEASQPDKPVGIDFIWIQKN
jgi:hypothetical protein